MILDYILILGALQGFLLSFIIYFKNSYLIAYKYLAAFLFVISLGCLADNNLGIFDLDIFVIVWAANSFLVAPLLYLFIWSLVSGNKSFQLNDLWHLLPFVVIKMVTLMAHFFGIEESELLILIGTVLNFGLIAYNFIYIILSLGLVKVFKANLIKKKNLLLIKILIWVFAVYNVVFLIRRVATLVTDIELTFVENYLYIGAAILMYFISFKIVSQPNIFVKKSKYRKSTIRIDDIEVYGKRIEHYFKAKEDYLTPGFTILHLANDLDLDKHKLSQVIGQYFNSNFYELLNNYRIKIVCERLAKGDHKKLNILGIAFNCGYSSKSTFNTAFKKVKGITPSQYLLTLKK